jgi:hypothetical protein
MGERARQRRDDEFSEQEAQQRFEKLVKAALNTKPKPLKDIPLKWSGRKRRPSGAALKTRPKPLKSMGPKGVPVQSKKNRTKIPQVKKDKAKKRESKAYPASGVVPYND